MTYHTISDITKAIMDEFDSEPPMHTERSRYLSWLVRSYYDALHNPPEGVIGVGAITYAENVLVKIQQEQH